MQDSEIVTRLLSARFDKEAPEDMPSMPEVIDLICRLRIEEQKEKPAEETDGKIIFAGQKGAYKRRLWERLTAYHDANGVGSIARIQSASNGTLSYERIRSMLNAEKHTIVEWELLEAALDRVEKERSADE